MCYIVLFIKPLSSVSWSHDSTIDLAAEMRCCCALLGVLLGARYRRFFFRNEAARLRSASCDC